MAIREHTPQAEMGNARWIVLPAITALATVLGGCDAGGTTEVGWVVRDSAGITIVENDHRSAAWTEATAWRLSEEPILKIGSVEGDETQMLHQVIHSARLSDGRVAVVNSGSSEIRIFDGAGDFLQAIGGEGDGPGELRSPWKLHALPGDSLLVIELYREITVYAPDGTYARVFTTETPDEIGLGHGLEPVDQFGDGTLLWRSHYREDESAFAGTVRRNRIAMVRSHHDGSFAGSLGDFDDQTIYYGAEAEYLFGPWAKEAAGEGSMWYGPGDVFELREIGFDGALLRLVRLDRPRRPVTDADVDQYRDDMLERVMGTRSEEFMRRRVENAIVPDSFPAHFEMMTDRGRNLWVQDYRHWSLPVERVWTVLSPEGRYLGDVALPAGFSPHDIGHDYVLGRWTDDLDVEYVVMYALRKPTG